MSYHDTKCPCGGKKPPDTMLCDDCMAWLKDDEDMAIFQGPPDVRAQRPAAIRLLNKARRRRIEQAKNKPKPPQQSAAYWLRDGDSTE